MAVARGDESSSNLARKRPPRKPPETGAPPTGPVRLDDLYRLERVRATALSPDGKELVYERQWTDETGHERHTLWRSMGADRLFREPLPL